VWQQEVQQRLTFSVNVDGGMDKSVIDTIGATWARGESFSRKHRHFLGFAMAAVIGSVDSRSPGNMFRFEYFDLWLFIDHVKRGFLLCDSTATGVSHCLRRGNAFWTSAQASRSTSASLLPT